MGTEHIIIYIIKYNVFSNPWQGTELCAYVDLYFLFLYKVTFVKCFGILGSEHLCKWKIISEPETHRWMEERRNFTHKHLQLYWGVFLCIFVRGQIAQHHHHFISCRSSICKYHLAWKTPSLIPNTFSCGQDIAIQFLFWGSVSKAWNHSYDEHNPELNNVLSGWTRQDQLRRAHTIWRNTLSARQGLGPQENWLLLSEQSLKWFYHSGQMSDIISTLLLFTSIASFAKQNMGTKMCSNNL